MSHRIATLKLVALQHGIVLELLHSHLLNRRPPKGLLHKLNDATPKRQLVSGRLPSPPQGCQMRWGRCQLPHPAAAAAAAAAAVAAAAAAAAAAARVLHSPLLQETGKPLLLVLQSLPI